MNPKKTIAIGFSSSAYNLLERLQASGYVNLIGLPAGSVLKKEIASEKLLLEKPQTIFQRFWNSDSTFIVVGAVGAVVRIISPLITSKEIDPAVLVIDSEAKNIIPILGSHKSGAEEFACSLAQGLGSDFVHTGFSRTQEILPIDSFGDSWGWVRKGKKNEWDDLMFYLAKQNKILVEQKTGSSVWKFSKGASNTFEFISSNDQLNNHKFPLLRISSEDVDSCCWHPPTLWLGIGCERNTSVSLVERSFNEALKSASLAKQSLAGIATIDLKSNEIAIKALQTKQSVPIRFYSSKELCEVSVPNPSDVVQQEVGTPSVAEAASLLAAGNKGIIKFEKHIFKANSNEKGSVTIAIAESEIPFAPHKGELHLVGSGPGDLSFLTHDARFALARSVVWIGYKRYLDLLEPFRRFDQVRIDSSLTNELQRCKEALKLATEGIRVSLISSGDSGIYGMAGLALELLLAKSKADRPSFEVHPGISSIQMAAAQTGAPLMHDFCSISLSDYLTSWEKIEKRIEAAAISDFVIAFYNPRSKDRNWQLEKALEILLEYRSSKTPVVFARQLGRPDQRVEIHSLGNFPKDKVDMLTILLIGNSSSFLKDKYVLTPRGYKVD